MSKYAIVGMFLQTVFFSVIDARDVEGQNSIENIYVNLNLKDTNLAEIFHEIENATQFTFSYKKKVIGNKKIPAIKSGKTSLANILREIAKKTNLQFKRVNNTIHVAKATTRKPKIFEILDSRETVEITGKVTDENGESLPGVSILEKGTTNGTITDEQGMYQLEVANENATLIFSFVGYLQEEIDINGRTQLDIAILPDIQALEEIVVIGYGTQKKANLTGAVASVSGDELKNIPVASTGSLLQGRLPGATVSNFAQQPGVDDPQIRIRGVSSITGGNNPLIIVDGIESTISQLPAEDIESVTVLKDAASAAIYGVRAANGVVLITTKRGTASPPQVTLSTNFSFQKPIVKPDFLDSWDYAEVRNIWSEENGGAVLYTDEMIQAMRDGSDPDRWANTDWFDVAFRTAPMQKHYASVRGGGERVKYLVSAEYLDQDGIMKGTGFDRTNFRANVDVNVSKRFKTGINLYGYRSKQTETALFPASGTGDSGLNYSVRRFTRPTVPIRLSNGEWGFQDGRGDDDNSIRNIEWISQTGEDFTERYRFEGQLFGEVEVINGLNFKSSLGVVFNNGARTRFIPTYEHFGIDGDLVSNNVNNSLFNNDRKFVRSVFNNLLTYQKNINNHDFKILAGQSAQYERTDFMSVTAQNFANNALFELDAGVTATDFSGWATEYTIYSLFGRVNYAYQDKYLLEVNVRRDGSSRFPANNRFAVFPSISVGWAITEEDFMPESSILSYAKIRASWGKLGNQDLINNPNNPNLNYPYSQTLATGHNYIINGGEVGGVAITEIANSNLTWETTVMTDIGIDFGLFDNKIQLNFDYFNKECEDCIVRLPIPRTLGASTAPFRNIGKISNKGWEANITHNNRIGEFTYSANFNISYLKNEIIDIDGLENWISGTRINVEGQPINSYFAIKSLGIYQTQEEINEHGITDPTLAPGDLKYEDVNEDGVINNDDRQIIGNPFPEYTYAFNLSGEFKGFDVSLFFQGIQGIDRFYWFNTENTGNFTRDVLDYWSENNTDAEFPRLGNAVNNTRFSSFYLRDASYLRLKILNIGYTLPKSILNNTFIDTVRIYFSGYNLLTFTEEDDYDPERTINDDRNRQYPGAKVLSFGLNITL